METLKKRPLALSILITLLGAAALAACNSDATPTAIPPTPTATRVTTSIQSGLLPSPTENAPFDARRGTPQPLNTPAATIPSASSPPPTVVLGTIAKPTIAIGTIAIATAKPKVTATSIPVGKIVADSAFRPDPDGYSFENYPGKKRNGKPVPELFVDDLVKMFGDTDVCIKLVNGVCTPRQEALDWLSAMNSQPPGGHCEGMAVSSLVLFKGLDSPTNYGPDAKTTHDLKFTEPVKHLISYYFFLQSVDPVATEYNVLAALKPSQVLDQVIASMQNGTPDPVNLGFYGGEPDADGNIAGHSIVPYAVEDHGNGIFWIYVYDNNWPDKTDAYMEVDRNKETWTYDLSAREPSQKPEVWTGDADTQTLAALPISWRTGTLICPWCDDSSGSSPGDTVGSTFNRIFPALSLVNFSASGNQSSAAPGGSSMQVILNGSGHLLITNSKGQSLGFDGTNKINQIPGARVVVPRGGLGVKIQPVYYLPKGDSYTVNLQGQTAGATTADTSTLSLFGQDLALTLQDLDLSKSSAHKLTVSADAQKFSFVAGDSNSKPTFRISTTAKSGSGLTAGAPASYLFQMGNVDVTTGQQLDFALNKPSGRLDVKATGGTAAVTDYDLEMIRTDKVSTTTFRQARLTLHTSDTHKFDFSKWKTGQVDVGIDHGSNGTVDATQVVPTAAPATATPNP